ncbi:ST8SIA4 [Branchiostoma lanceolatum]|uniref:ST8SIA4 protein n=1 Tax=Branchiostoma lanceolatum TaxID=7740 RepID=A0A8J9Z8R7_BRALA|nr:ST8SIA4 [Branchiostoma lanceolatum]
MQPKLLRSLSTTARRRRCTLTMTLASALTFLAFTFVYVDSNCSRNARSFKKTVVSRVQRHALMEDNNGRIALGDVRWYSAPNNRSFYIAARDNVSVVLEKRKSKTWSKGAKHTGNVTISVYNASLSTKYDKESSRPIGNISSTARHSPAPTAGENRVTVQAKTKNNTTTSFSTNYRFEKVNKWSTWDIWPIDEAALRKIRTLSRALLPRFGMGKDEIRPDSTRLHKCVKKSRGCKLDDKNAIRHYQTCAVVGNSGILTGSHCGGEIDAHDYVIRFSVGPTAGYEDDVGTKRNITFLNKDNLLKISKSLRLPSSKNVYAQRLTRMNASTFMFAKGKNKEWNTDIKSLITIARRNNLCFTLRKNTKNLGIIIRGIISQEMPDLAQHLGGVDTTGMMSVFMASTFCHRINLYGFYPFTKDTRGKDIRYHYYDNVKPRRQGSVDNYPTEFMVNKRLHRLGVVNHVIDKCQ